MKQVLLTAALFFSISFTYAQTGKYVTVQDNRKQVCKVYVEYGVIEFAGDSFNVKWTGASKSGFAEGSGSLSIDSKLSNNEFHITYSGVLQKGKKNGKGSFKVYNRYESFAPYFSYTGGFMNDEMEGIGEMKADWGYSRSENIYLKVTKHPIYRRNFFFKTYKGLFKEGKIADTEYGEGTTDLLIAVADEVYYEGGIKNGKPDGQGEASASMNNAVQANGASMGHYKGGFVKGKFDGPGKLAKGLIIEEGLFENNKLNGKGKRTYNKYEVFFRFSGNEDCAVKTIEGNFVNGESTGQTVIYFQDCDAIKFSGFTDKGNINGTGIIDYLDGSVFRGNIRDNMKSGRGVISFSDGTSFDGVFENNKPVTGKMTYEGGSWYEGEMGQTETNRNGKVIYTLVRNGAGTMHEKDGRSYKVNCVNDNCTITN